MGKKNRNKKKLKRSQRRLIRFFAISILFLVLLQVGLYFGSDLFLRSYVQNKVNEASAGKYEVGFDRFHLSIFQRGFYFEGFVLSPNRAIEDSLSHEQPLYKIKVPEIAVKGIGYDFSEKVLEVGSLRFANPMIQTRQKLDSLGSSSKLEQLQHEIKNSLEGVPLEEIVIKNLYLDHADLLIENFVSQKSIKAENTNFYLKDVRLLNPRPSPTPFNAEGFGLTLENFEMLLADSVHTLYAKQIEVSSLDNHITAKQVALKPDLDKPREIYYNMELADLKLTDADINQVFYTTDVNVGNLNLNNPSFLVYSELSPDVADQSLLDYSLYPLIQDILASISIDHLEIEEGQFLQRGVNDEYKNRIEAERIDFEMDRVYIGPDVERSQNQFFYADDAALTLSKVKVVLADGVHWITGDQVFLSSKEDELKVSGAKVEPFREVNEQIPLFEIEIPEFNLENANLKKVYNHNVLDVKDMVFRNPTVKFSNIRKKQGELKGQTIQELTKNFLRAIYIDRLELIEGDMTLNNNLKINKDSVSFEKASMVLENFAVDEGIEQDSSRMFLAEDLQLELDNYAMKLTDDLHVFKAKKIFVDTKEKLLKIDGFSFEPLQPDMVMENLQRLNKRMVLEVHVPEFYLKEVDIAKAYFDGVLEIGMVEVPSPDIRLSRFVAPMEKKEKVQINDLYELATSYFSYINIDSLNVIDGSIAYENFVRDKIKTFAEDDVSIRIKNFELDENVTPRNAETFFAEELDISLNNYVFNVADGRYSLHADKISYNSSRDELVTSNVRLRPRRDLGVKVTIGADISNLSFSGVDVDRFFFENTLAMSKVSLSNAEVNLFIDQNGERKGDKEKSTKRKRHFPKRLDVIQIDTVEANNARFSAFYSDRGHERNLISTGVNLSFYGFLLDSAKLNEGDIVGFFDNMAMDIDDFNLALNDSVHTLSFSKVELDTKSDLIQFENLKIIPKNYQGNPGDPVIAANVPLVKLKTRSLTSFQETGEIDFEKVELIQPQINLYLDKKEVGKVSGKEGGKAVQDVVKNLEVRDFNLVGGQLKLLEKDSVANMRSFNGLNIALNDLSFDLSNAEAFDKDVFLSKDFFVELPDYEIKLPDSLNILHIGLVAISKDQMRLKNVTLEPRFGRYEYVRKVGYQTDVVKASFPEIRFDAIDLNTLIEKRAIKADKMFVQAPNIHVFRDKRMPFNDSLRRPMPQELMKKAGVNVELDTLEVEKAVITYEEFPEKGMIPGSITFDSLYAKMHPFHLSKTLEDTFSIDSTTLTAAGRINGMASVQVDARFYYQAPYPMEMAVRTGSFDLKTVNSIMTRNAFLKIREGVAKPSYWHFTADNDVARGQMEFFYNGLKVQLLNDRTLEKAKGRKAMLNFVLNAFAVRGNNPRRIFGTEKIAPIYFERDKRKFIFNYWWKASLSGFKGSLGLGEAGPAKKEEEEEGIDQ
ncbi:hypothetical protein DN752_09545 [Echinicola strongylocentroti]|uniref:Uncharacterized protein n=1 Tax=Echinicola strongylocentroti TaxID=1795355 RepID=A0A2Z4IH76_9BACT|nr:hypothetical protein [Echinicola strongylocentroti]AWW30344.1 hypothetical protein DN752_09545 [Echinicola strongylocentroti]